MNKILIQIGLLTFFLAIFFFTRMGMPLEDIILKSLVIFLAVTILLSFLTLVFFKSMNSISPESDDEISDNLNRK